MSYYKCNIILAYRILISLSFSFLAFLSPFSLPFLIHPLSHSFLITCTVYSSSSLHFCSFVKQFSIFFVLYSLFFILYSLFFILYSLFFILSRFCFLAHLKLKTNVLQGHGRRKRTGLRKIQKGRRRGWILTQNNQSRKWQYLFGCMFYQRIKS
jgi:hypothetical protein